MTNEKKYYQLKVMIRKFTNELPKKAQIKNNSRDENFAVNP